MAVLNDFKKDYKKLLIEEDMKVGELAELMNISSTNIPQIFNAGVILKDSFVKLVDTLGYDIEVTYRKRKA